MAVIRRYIQPVSPDHPWGWKIRDHGYFSELAYERDAVDARLPFSEQC